MRRPLLLVLLTAAAACASPTGVTDGALQVTRGAAQLQLRNLSASPLSYVVVERGTLALFDWIPCAGPSCPTVGPRATVFVPYSAICGYTANAREAVVYWWRAVADSTVLVPADWVHSLVTPL